ncbi:MAG: phosphonate metabolism protein/1,5-bisphosphokinase (PRPP-forming) PhnN, partial [Rhodospirillales bacterium]|nr:phosphonate metabolism protein/1,5-bisphosphokinase (PRPP-forming) PhnN [Rhodospirillales bacterium]
MAAGTLYLIVGPSGAGKDTLIDGVRTALAESPDYVFARRVITRPAETGAEDHRPATDEEFQAFEAADGFMVSWRAHGLCYGLEKSLETDLAQGRHVIANVSRAVLADLIERFPSYCVVEITAAPEILAERLAHRGRESAADIAERLAREASKYPPGAKRIT